MSGSGINGKTLELNGGFCKVCTRDICNANAAFQQRDGLYGMKPGDEVDTSCKGYRQIHSACSAFVATMSRAEGGVLEIGTQYGGSCCLWVDCMRQSGGIRTITTVDPATGPFFDIGLERIKSHLGGDAKFWKHYNMTDVAFMEIFDEVPKSRQRYSFIYLDGPHDDESVKAEFDFFYNKINPGGTILIDDTSREAMNYIIGKYPKFTRSEFSNHSMFEYRGM
jgi:hypothetical protein